MPTAMVYIIRPLQAGSVPSSLGRATHAAILRLIREADPDLAATIHDEGGVKPLTVSNVQGLGNGRFSQVDPERDYYLRVTLLSPELEAIAQTWTPDVVERFDLDGTWWQVVARTSNTDEDRWAGQASYTDLAAPLLERPTNLPQRWEFQFAAPVTFRRQGINVPVPLPELVFGNLLEKWNTFAPMALPDEVRRFAEERLAINRYDLRTVAGPTSGGALQIGAIGRCSYIAVGHDRYWQACITTLARFARYAGIGAGTARGFGQARLLEE